MKQYKKLVYLLLILCLSSCGLSQEESGSLLMEYEEQTPDAAVSDTEGFLCGVSLPEGFDTDELYEKLIEYINYLSWCNPSDFPQEEYCCQYRLYDESGMNKFSYEHSIWFEFPSLSGTAWYSCTLNRQGYYFQQFDEVAARKVGLTLLASGTLIIPAVSKPEFEVSDWKTAQLEALKQSLPRACEELFADELSKGCSVEILLADFDAFSGMKPRLILMCGSKVYWDFGGLNHKSEWLLADMSVTFALQQPSLYSKTDLLDASEFNLSEFLGDLERIREIAVIMEKYPAEEERFAPLTENVTYRAFTDVGSAEVIELAFAQGEGVEIDLDGDRVPEQLYLTADGLYINGYLQDYRPSGTNGNVKENLSVCWLVDVNESDSYLNLILPYGNGQCLAYYDSGLHIAADFTAASPQVLAEAEFDGEGCFFVKDVQFDFPVSFLADAVFLLSEDGGCSISGEVIRLPQVYFFETLSEIELETEEEEETVCGGSFCVGKGQMVSIVATDGINRVWLKTEDGNLGWCTFSGREEFEKSLKLASAGRR